MIENRIIALLAFAMFLTFFAILVFSVKRVDMGIVIAIGIGFVGFDLWRQLSSGKK